MLDSLTAISSAMLWKEINPDNIRRAPKRPLDSVISLGETIYTATNYTQQEVNNALSNLARAGVTFNSQLLQEVSKANLMGYWKFTGNPA